MDSTASDASSYKASAESLLELSEFATIATSLADSSSLAALNDDRSDSGTDEDEDGATTGGDVIRRQEHNVCERRRRNNIRHGFESLQSSIPHATMKLSKMEILRTGITYIKRMNEEIAELQEEISRLQEQKAKGASKEAAGQKTS